MGQARQFCMGHAARSLAAVVSDVLGRGRSARRALVRLHFSAHVNLASEPRVDHVDYEHGREGHGQRVEQHVPVDLVHAIHPPEDDGLRRDLLVSLRKGGDEQEEYTRGEVCGKALGETPHERDGREREQHAQRLDVILVWRVAVVLDERQPDADGRAQAERAGQIVQVVAEVEPEPRVEDEVVERCNDRAGRPVEDHDLKLRQFA
eukprot:1524845-Pleurochrysis_carterae.AAC.1